MKGEQSGMKKITWSGFNFICFTVFITSKGFGGLSGEVRLQMCRKLICKIYGGMTVWEIGEIREGEEEKEPEMEWNTEKTSLGQVLGERLEQVFCHD